MIGKVFGSWEVLSLDNEHPKTKKGILYYKSKCLECNLVYSVLGAGMRNGGTKRCTKCGCGHSHAPQFGQVRTKRTPEETAHHYLYNLLKKDAKKRVEDWQLSRDEVRALVTGNCEYCGRPPMSVCTPLKHFGLSQKNASAATILRNGIDRVDSSKGYITDNVVSCCAKCNIGKMDDSSDEFLDWAKQIAKHQGWIK